MHSHQNSKVWRVRQDKIYFSFGTRAFFAHSHPTNLHDANPTFTAYQFPVLVNPPCQARRPSPIDPRMLSSELLPFPAYTGSPPPSRQIQRSSLQPTADGTVHRRIPMANPTGQQPPPVWRKRKPDPHGGTRAPARCARRIACKTRSRFEINAAVSANRQLARQSTMKSWRRLLPIRTLLKAVNRTPQPSPMAHGAHRKCA